jgi:hypothetical protein
MCSKRCKLDAKGQHVALADAHPHEGMRAGLQRGTQPSGTHHWNGGLMEQVGTTGGYGYGVGAHLENTLSRALAGGALDQPVDDLTRPSAPGPASIKTASESN